MARINSTIERQVTGALPPEPGRRLKVGSGRVDPGQHPRCTTAPLRNLPSEHRCDECLLRVGSVNSLALEAAVHRPDVANDGNRSHCRRSSWALAMTALAEEQSLPEVTLTVRSWPF